VRERGCKINVEMHWLAEDMKKLAKAFKTRNKREKETNLNMYVSKGLFEYRVVLTIIVLQLQTRNDCNI
jgi:ribosome-associated toxin RatA of RatAB toxin-antitoxin module